MRLADALRMSYGVVRSTWLSPRPYIIYIKPTARCDCRCRICRRWQEPSDIADEMKTDEIRSMLRMFRDLGAALVVAWGGEPLLRSDIAEIFRAAKEMGYRTSMCTNARQLAKKADAVMPWLDTVLCSLDGHGPNHDAYRGVEGTFERAVEGLRAARSYPHKRVKIWASMHAENVGDIEPLARLAKELGIWVEYFPISNVPGHNDAMVLDREGLARAFDRIRGLKRAGYPVWNTDAVLDKMRNGARFRCNFGHLTLQVDHRGNVTSCESPDGTQLKPWGRWDEVDWRGLLASRRFAEEAADLEKCERCRLPCVVELSDNLAEAYASMFLQSLRRGA